MDCLCVPIAMERHKMIKSILIFILGCLGFFEYCEIKKLKSKNEEFKTEWGNCLLLEGNYIDAYEKERGLYHECLEALQKDNDVLKMCYEVLKKRL